MHRRRALFALITASISPIPTHAIPQNAADNSVCARQDLLACPSTLPSGFCCPKDTTCQALAGNTTALCCPTGSSCDRIQPIPCNVSLQDPKTNPDGSVLTSVFTVKLETCDNGCCPFGYTCADKISAAGQVTNPQCIRDEDQSKKPGQESSTTTTSATTTTTTTSNATASSTATSSPTAPAQATASPGGGGGGGGMKSNTMSIIGGVVGGSLVLLILVIVGILYIRRRNRARSHTQRYEKSTFKGPPGGGGGGSGGSGPSSFTAVAPLTISEPIVQHDASFRTDFILKSPSAMSSISNKPINSRWSGSTGHHHGHGSPQQQQPRLQPFLKPRNLTPASANQRSRLSIPNPFSSPNPSVHRASAVSSASPFAHADDDCVSDDDDDDKNAKTGHVVNGRLAPIHNMRPSSQQRVVSRHTETQHIRREASEESINVFADANAVPSQERAPQHQQQQMKSRDIHEAKNRMTTFSDLVDNADLGGVHRGKERYVPGTTPRL